MASWVFSLQDRVSAAVTRSQRRASGFPGLCSSPGARPARAGRSPPGLPHSPLRSPQQNIPANCGRWPASRTPAPTPSSLLFSSPGALAAVASPRSLASLLLPQPRRSPLSRGVSHGASSRPRAEPRKEQSGTRTCSGDGGLLRACPGSAPRSQVAALPVTRGRTPRTPRPGTRMATTAFNARRGAKTPRRGSRAFWVL